MSEILPHLGVLGTPSAPHSMEKSRESRENEALFSMHLEARTSIGGAEDAQVGPTTPSLTSLARQKVIEPASSGASSPLCVNGAR